MTSPTSNWSVTDHILKGLARSRPGDARMASHWPSEGTATYTEDGREIVAGQCRRQSFFRYLKDASAFNSEGSEDFEKLLEEIKLKEIPPTPYQRFIWAAGELYEEYIVNQAKTNGIFCYGQAPVYIKSHNVSGKIDLVVINPMTGKLSIVEVKSVYGYNANEVMGSDADHRRGRGGRPRDKNLIQIALYHWWVASNDKAYEESRLLYGARDTGKFIEYLVKTEEQDGIIYIYYKAISPVKTEWIKSEITLNSVLEQYSYVREHYSDLKKVPPRDFKYSYDREDLDRLYDSGSLTKAETAQFEKVLEREKENLERISQDKKPKVELKLPDKGDYQCRYCPFRDVCYSSEGVAREW